MTERKPAAKAEQSNDKTSSGVFVARVPLHVDGALAFTPGDIVPAGHVTKFGWRDKVRDFDDDTETGD